MAAIQLYFVYFRSYSYKVKYTPVLLCVQRATRAFSPSASTGAAILFAFATSNVCVLAFGEHGRCSFICFCNEQRVRSRRRRERALQSQHNEIEKDSGECKRSPESFSISLRCSLLMLHSTIEATRPEPTVWPPSRIAKVRPCSMAIGWISSMLISTLSPGMHISTPSGRLMTPVTSVVRK